MISYRFFILILFLQLFYIVGAQDIIYEHHQYCGLSYIQLKLDTVKNRYTFLLQLTDLFRQVDTGIISYRNKKMILNTSLDSCNDIITEAVKENTDSIYYQLSYIDSDWIACCKYIFHKDTITKYDFDNPEFTVFAKPKKFKRIEIIIDIVHKINYSVKYKLSNYFVIKLCNQKNNSEKVMFHKLVLSKKKEYIVLKEKSNFRKPIKLKLASHPIP